jgi:Spy/CpxP family protein refolding chaperone
MAVVGAVLLSGAAVAMAQPTSRPTSRLAPGERMENAIKQLNLTAEQAQKVRDIMKVQEEAGQAFFKENGDKLKDLQDQAKTAREAKDETKLAEVRKEMETLRAPLTAARAATQKSLEGVLSKEQMDKWRELMAPPQFGARERIQMLVTRLGLTDDQKKSAKAIVDDAQAAADKATEPKDKAPIWEAAFQKFVKDVLTDDQRAKLKEMRANHEGGPGATTRPFRPRGDRGGNPPPPPAK